MNAIKFQELTVPLRLQGLIQAIRVAESPDQAEGLEVKVCPGGYAGLVWAQTRDGLAPIESIQVEGRSIQPIPRFFLHGLITRPSIMKFSRNAYLSIQMLFKADAIRLIGQDPNLGNFKFISADQLGFDSLDERLLHEPLIEGKTDFLSRLIADLLDKSPVVPDKTITACVEYINSHFSTVSTAGLCDRFAISERNLERRFRASVGISAKLFVRIIRAQAAMALIRQGHYEHLSDVAMALNYYDQSHFIRELRHFSFLSPKGVNDSTLEHHQDINGFSYL